MKFVIFRRRNLLGRVRYYFHLVGANGEIIVPSEGYSRKIDCVNSLHMVRNSNKAEIIDDAGAS